MGEGDADRWGRSWTAHYQRRGSSTSRKKQQSRDSHVADRSTKLIIERRRWDIIVRYL